MPSAGILRVTSFRLCAERRERETPCRVFTATSLRGRRDGHGRRAKTKVDDNVTDGDGGTSHRAREVGASWRVHGLRDREDDSRHEGGITRDIR